MLGTVVEYCLHKVTMYMRFSSIVYFSTCEYFIHSECEYNLKVNLFYVIGLLSMIKCTKCACNEDGCVLNIAFELYFIVVLGIVEVFDLLMEMLNVFVDNISLLRSIILWIDIYSTQKKARYITNELTK